MTYKLSPFTEDEINSINEFQKCIYWHPFTCGDGCEDALIATVEGMRCPKCVTYRQNWVHDFMANWKWIR